MGFLIAYIVIAVVIMRLVGARIYREGEPARFLGMGVADPGDRPGDLGKSVGYGVMFGASWAIWMAIGAIYWIVQGVVYVFERKLAQRVIARVFLGSRLDDPADRR